MKGKLIYEYKDRKRERREEEKETYERKKSVV